MEFPLNRQESAARVRFAKPPADGFFRDEQGGAGPRGADIWSFPIFSTLSLATHQQAQTRNPPF